MRAELADQLRDRYPAVYGACREVWVGDGWHGILDALGEQLARLAGDEADGVAPAVTAIKEKLGGLRVMGVHLGVEGCISIGMAETLSRRVCECCGRPGQMIYDREWARTRCAEHRDTPVTYAAAAG
ncbi:hypothetical protein [Geopseudomonas aromaticivorans]